MKLMNVLNSTLPSLASCQTGLFPYKNPFFSDHGRLRDFFHELYLTLSITPLVSTSDGAGMHPCNPYFRVVFRVFLKTYSIPSILFQELGQN